MNKDKSLKKKGSTLVFLICGNSLVGKKTFVEKFIKSIIKEEVMPINKSFYNVYLFDITYEIDEKIITLPIEIRIINSKIYS
jgi:septin family protein